MNFPWLGVGANKESDSFVELFQREASAAAELGQLYPKVPKITVSALGVCGADYKGSVTPKLCCILDTLEEIFKATLMSGF